MKRAEFIALYQQLVTAHCAKSVTVGDMRVSEAAMTRANAPREAANLWRKVRRSVPPITAADMAKMIQEV